MKVPFFGSCWTEKMAAWIREQVEDLPEADQFRDPTMEFLCDHWEAICESYGCKDKWNRVTACVQTLVDGEEMDQLNLMSECWAKGHIIVDCSSAGPDSGNMDHECSRCGRGWVHRLY